jgi:hypothetical protein
VIKNDRARRSKQASSQEARAKEEEIMPTATVTRTVTLTDGSIKRTIEKQHKDGNGNILRILSKTEEIIFPQSNVLAAAVASGGVTRLPDTTTRPKVADRLDDPQHKQDNILIAQRLGSHHDTSPLLDDPQEQDDFLIARLRNASSHRDSSSSNNGSSFQSLHSGESASNHKSNKHPGEASLSSIPSIQSRPDNRYIKAVQDNSTLTSSIVGASSPLDDPNEHFLIARLRDSSRQNSSNTKGSSASTHTGHSGMSGPHHENHQTGRDGSSSSIQSIHSLQGTRSASGGGGDSLIDHLRRVNLQNKSLQQDQAPVVTNPRPVHQRPNVRHEEESPLPATMVQAQPLLQSNQFTIKTVSMENWLADGTVVVRTEKHKVYADGSVHVLESRDVPLLAPKPAMNSATRSPRSPGYPPPATTTTANNTANYDPTSSSAMPIRLQTSATPTSSPQPPVAALPVRIQTAAMPQIYRPTLAATNTSAVSYAANSATSALPTRVKTYAVPASSNQLPAVLPVSIPTAVMPQALGPSPAATTNNATMPQIYRQTSATPTATNTSTVNYAANSATGALLTRVQTYAVPSISSQLPAVLPVSIPTAVMPQGSGPSPAATTTATNNAINNGQQLPTYLPAVVGSRPMSQPPQQQQQIQQQPNGSGGGGGGIDRLQLAEGVLNLFERAHNIFGGGESEPDHSGDINFNINIGDTAQQQQQQQQSNNNGNNNMSIGDALRWAKVGLGAGDLAVNLLGLNDEELLGLALLG